MYYSVFWNVIRYRRQPDFPSVDYKLNFRLKASVHLMQFQLSFVLLKI